MQRASHSLPNEILREIFSYLLADDRKNVRLTCRQFYELCDELCVQGSEEVVFHVNRNAGSALQFLSSSRRRIRNIRLNGVHINDVNFLPFFENHGCNIHSLILKQCVFGPGLLRSIMQQCSALRSIVLVLSDPVHFQHVFDDIRAMSENSITYNEVVELKLQMVYVYPVYQTKMSNLRFLQFFSLFPNVRRVNLEFIVNDTFNYLSTSPSCIMSNSRFTLSCVYDRIKAVRSQLEKLRLHFYGFEHTLETTEEFTKIEMENLKELSLNWIDHSHSLSTNPFPVFKNVTHFCCDFCSNYPHISASAVIQLILCTITEIRTIVLNVSEFPITKQCFEALVRSRLTKLEIIIFNPLDAFFNDIYLNFEWSSLESTLVPNNKMRDLWINDGYYPFALEFAKYFRGIERIAFLDVEEPTLHSIFKMLNNLRNLKLINSYRENDHCGPNSSFIEYTTYQQYLQNDDLSQYRLLPYLTDLDIREDHVSLTNFLLREFAFPQLRSLTIIIYDKDEEERDEDEEERDEEQSHQLWPILMKLTQLRYIKLELEKFSISFQEILVLVQSLSNLRDICIKTDLQENFSSAAYHSLFKARSSLRSVIHNTKKYFFDVTTNVIEEISNPCSQRLAVENNTF